MAFVACLDIIKCFSVNYQFINWVLVEVFAS